MNKTELIKALNIYPDVRIEIFGVGAVTNIEFGRDEKGESIRLISQSKALTAIEAVRQLKSTACKCGEEKKTGTAFCAGCYYRLPKPIQKALYSRVGSGYEEAYKFACKTLEEKR